MPNPSNAVYQDRGGRLRCDPSRVEPSERVRVAVRVRPIGANSKMPDAGEPCLDTTQHTVRTQVGHPPRWKSYSFDHVFTGGQEEIDRTVGTALLDDVLAGYNVTLFAYGQTGTGKTYSMLGGQTRDTEGIIPRFCRRLFQMTEAKAAADPDVEFQITAEYVEIYNEQIRDLLVPAENQQPLSLIRDRTDHKVKVHGVTVCPVKTAAEMANLVAYGNVQRQVQETACNERSSRSHCVLLVRVCQRIHSTGDIIQSEAVLVDLAGSERANPRQPLSHDRFEELRRINKSLHVLGRALKDGGEFSQGMLRESKLTWLLSSSLGGANCRTWMLACVNPTEDSRSITNVTMEYAANAMTLLNQAIVNRFEEQRAADAAAAKQEARAALARDRDAARQVRERLGAIGDVEGGVQNAAPGAAAANITEAEVAQLRQIEADLQKRVTELEARLATSEETQTSLRDEIQALLGEFLASARSVDTLLGAVDQQNGGGVAAAAQTGAPETANIGVNTAGPSTMNAAVGGGMDMGGVGVDQRGMGGGQAVGAGGVDALGGAFGGFGPGFSCGGGFMSFDPGLGLGGFGGCGTCFTGSGGSDPFGRGGGGSGGALGCVVHGKGACAVGMGMPWGGAPSLPSSSGGWGGFSSTPAGGMAMNPLAMPTFGSGGQLFPSSSAPSSLFSSPYPAPPAGHTRGASIGGAFPPSYPPQPTTGGATAAVGGMGTVSGGRYTVTGATASVSRGEVGADGRPVHVNYNIYVSPTNPNDAVSLTSGGVGSRVVPNETVKEVVKVASSALPPPDAFLR